MKRRKPQRFVTFGWEPLIDLLNDGLREIAVDHWNELGTNKEDVPLAVDWDQYLALEAAGTWRIFAVRIDEELVGYISWYLLKPPRYCTTLHCQEDYYYLLPKYREGWFGVRMFLESLRLLPRPSRVYVSYKIHFMDGRMAALFKRLGFEPSDVLNVAYLR